MAEPVIADGPWLVEASAVTRDFPGGRGVVRALRGVDLRVRAGRFLVVSGRSGAGKTTLLNVIGGLDRPTSGKVIVDGEDVTALDEAGHVRLRREKVAYIFQSFGLISILSAAENVELPLRLRGTDPGERRDRVADVLELVGLAERARHRPYELSGGEQQRVAIARALVNRPRLLLADEPTGQLDAATGQAIIELLRRVVEAEGVTAIVASHDPLLLGMAHEVVVMRDGALVNGDRS
ncbi:MAG: ABC transporter ATP-binding protein [Candidatus Limnocylindrales bacterium]